MMNLAKPRFQNWHLPDRTYLYFDLQESLNRVPPNTLNATQHLETFKVLSVCSHRFILQIFPLDLGKIIL